MWKPAVQCPECAYPNDDCFIFCQSCGYKRRPVDPTETPARIDLNLPDIDSRLSTLREGQSLKPYQKQKSKLQRDLESFLFSLPRPKSLASASPQDISRFLVWKDRSGKTKVHRTSCKFFGSRGSSRCACPTTLAAGTVDSIIGKLRSLFLDLGRGGEWNDILGIGNPASHPSIKRYLTALREEQARARITPKQATPFFFDKLLQLCTFLRSHIFADDVSPSQRYLYARDLAFFCLQFFSGDRASDLGRVFTKEVLALPGEEGLFFNHSFGKTLRGKDTNSFMVKRCQNPIICPVANLRLYVSLCDLMSVDVRDGFLFRSMDKRGAVSNKPFVGSAAAGRLTPHLKALGIYDGETVHSFRSGCSITMSLVGVPMEDVARHVGWRSLVTAEYYTQTGKVLNMSHAASTLADSTHAVEGSLPAAVSAAELFRSKNDLQSFPLAFP